MSTKLRTLFSKPVDRPIDGVIKADDEESLLIELEEYVVTNEIEKNISRFLSDYNNCQRRRKNLPLGRSKSRPVWGARLGACGPQIAGTFQGALAARPIFQLSG